MPRKARAPPAAVRPAPKRTRVKREEEEDSCGGASTDDPSVSSATHSTTDNHSPSNSQQAPTSSTSTAVVPRRRFQQEFDAVTGEKLSMETRARRAREFAFLQSENESLKRERHEFLQKIEALSAQVHAHESAVLGRIASASDLNLLRDATVVDAVAENQMLQREIALHQEFINEFKHVLVDEKALAATARFETFSRGIDAAHAFLLGLVAESVTWTMAIPPPHIYIPLFQLEFRFAFRTEMFGTPEQDGNKRLHLRLDAFVPGTSSEKVQDLFFRALCNHEDMQRLYGQSADVHLFRMDAPDPDTELLYFRKSQWKSPPPESSSSSKASNFPSPLYANASHTPQGPDQQTVFICNRKMQTMTRSTLSTPSQGLQFGTVAARIVAMTSTQLMPENEAVIVEVGRGREAVPVSGMVVKGILAWDDRDLGGTHLTVIYSVPEDFKIISSLDFGDILEGSFQHKANSEAAQSTKMSEKMANLLVHVAQQFTLMMAEDNGETPPPEDTKHVFSDGSSA